MPPEFLPISSVMDRNPNTNSHSSDLLSQVLQMTDANRVDFLIESRTYEVLLKAVPPFAPKCTLFEDSDPWKVSLWTADRPEDIRATLVTIRELLVPAGYKDMGMPRYIAALAATQINGEPAFPELSTAIETIRRVSDPTYWKAVAGQMEGQLVAV